MKCPFLLGDMDDRISNANSGIKMRPLLFSRRPGDPARLVASSNKAKKILGWKPSRGIEEIIRTAAISSVY